MSTVVSVEHVSKVYRLGTIGGGTLKEDFARWCARRRGQADPLLRLGEEHRVRRSGEQFLALDDVSFEVREGEVLGIIGRNGAGKSTLLKILSQVTAPTSGEIKIKGRVASLLEVGTGFHPELTARENIYLNGAILGMTRTEVEQKFDEIVEFSEMTEFLDTPVKRFSSGMYVRLAFAVAAHLESEILVVDEVLAVGDAQFRKKCMGKLDAAQRAGRTILFVSHQMNSVERLCSRAILIENGRLRMETSEVRLAIHAYLSSAESDSGSSRAEWRNSGDQYAHPLFQPQHVYLADAQGALLKMPAASDSEIWLHVRGEIRTLDPALMIGYMLYAESGELLYRSNHTDAREQEWPRVRSGKVALRAEIPRRLLNEGTYRIELIAALFRRQWILRPGGVLPAVSLSLQGGRIESPLHVQKPPGLLAPILSWKTCEEE